jgi:hypothetical protein
MGLRTASTMTAAGMLGLLSGGVGIDTITMNTNNMNR